MSDPGWIGRFTRWWRERRMGDRIADRIDGDLDRARRAEREFMRGHPGGAFEERDTLPGSLRARLYRRGRR